MSLTGRLSLALLLATSALARTTSPEDPDLGTGVRQVEEGDFEGAIVTLEPVARRLAPAGGPDAVQALVSLGIAQVALDQREAARRSFRQALDIDPGLELGPDRFSPKVRSALEEAREERDGDARVAGPATPTPGKGGPGKTLLLAGAGVAAGVGLAVALSGDSAPTASGEVRFSGARFSPPALECPNGVVDQPIAVGLDVDATNTGSSETLNAVSSTLIIVASPAVPGEVGFAGSTPTTVAPSVVPAGTATLHLQTTLLCSNGSGDAPRYNEWSGRVVLATAATAVTLETVDRLRVNIP